MAQFHAVFLSEAAASCAFTPTSTSINNSKPFQTQDLHYREHNYSKPKIISVFAAVSVGWCEECWPRVLYCGALTGGAPWWQHRCQRHWPRQVLLVTSVSLSALSVALVSNTQSSPHPCSFPGQQLRDTGSICPQLPPPSLQRTAARGHHSPRKVTPDSRGSLVGLQSLLAGSCCWNCQQGCHVWGWFPHPAAHTGTAGTQVRLWLINNNSLQADDSRPCFSSVWIWQLQGTDAWRFVLSFSNTPNMPSALLTPLLFLLPYDPWLQLISKRRQAQLLQIAVMFKLAPWWILEVANKKC